MDVSFVSRCIYMPASKQAMGFAEHSRELQMLALRRRLLQATRTAALTFSAPFVRRMSRKVARLPHVRLGYYHYVFPDQERGFERQLRYFLNHYRFISYSEAVQRIVEDRIDDRYFALSFDDGFENNARVAAPVLDRYNIKAMFFVVTDFIASKGDAARAEKFSRSRFDHEPLRNMTFDDLRALRAAGHEIGSHTVSHRRLSQLPHDELRLEIRESKRLLESELGAVVDHIAYPYGTASDFSSLVDSEVRGAGYLSCSSGIRGANTAATCVFDLHRDQLMADWPLSHIDFFMHTKLHESGLE